MTTPRLPLRSHPARSTPSVTPRTSLHIITTANPGKAIEVKIVMKSQPYAIGLRKDDPALRDRVNKWIDVNMKNGRLGSIYQKWLGVPLHTAMDTWHNQK